MRDSAWFNLVAGIVAVGIVAIGVVAVAYPTLSSAPTAYRPGTAQNPTAYRNLSIRFDPATGSFDYSSTQLAVPVGVTTVFTITNYDPGIAQVPSPADALVTGTVGNVMTVTSAGHTAQVRSVATGDLAHTFTMSNGPYHLNVPIPAASANGAPAVVVFSVAFQISGTYNWGCAVLCGPGGMMARDMMYGTITIS
jgi:hypothetical protein